MYLFMQPSIYRFPVLFSLFYNWSNQFLTIAINFLTKLLSPNKIKTLQEILMAQYIRFTKSFKNIVSTKEQRKFKI